MVPEWKCCRSRVREEMVCIGCRSKVMKVVWEKMMLLRWCERIAAEKVVQREELRRKFFRRRRI